MMDDTRFVLVAGTLEPADFSLEKHRRIFRRMGELPMAPRGVRYATALADRRVSRPLCAAKATQRSRQVSLPFRRFAREGVHLSIPCQNLSNRHEKQTADQRLDATKWLIYC
jgi:hypothetical protein